MRHHHHHHEHDHSHFKDDMRRKHGRGGASKRFFGRGRIKFALLELLQTQPMHGYQMMKALEIQSGGLYIPSPGSIYPVLQRLEDNHLISVEEQDGKKIYAITEEGSKFLEEAQAEPGECAKIKDHSGRGHRHFTGWKDPDTESGRLVRCIADAELECWEDPDRLHGLNALFVKQRMEIQEYMRQFDPDEGLGKEE